MCGFVGTYTKNLIKEKNIQILKNMNKTISHRGPDSSGIYKSKNYACAFSRLSIIDISNLANQPFSDPQKRYNLVYNGEIYNFAKLRRELEEKGKFFSTKSDTEVVLNSFIEWGVDCVKKFEGMFAFVVFDKKKNKIYMFRDQLGIKPIYYTKIGNSFYFASELKAFKKIVLLSLNSKKLVEYITWGNIVGEETLFQGIKQIEPGHYIKINSKLKINKKKYFDLKNTFSKSSKVKSFSNLENQLKNDIISHTVSDVNYGTQLSGGLDSSLITAIVSLNKSQKSSNKLRTFSTTLDNKAMNEMEYQNMVSKLYKTQHHKQSFKQTDAKTFLKKCIWMYDYPLHHPNIISSYLMSNLAYKKNIKVLLSGDGADELFVGYNWDLKNKISNKQVLGSNSYLPYEIASKLFNFKNNDITLRHEIIKDIKDNHIAQSLLNQKAFLDKWLQRQDRSGMFASVEIRVPYCNVKLFETINSISFKEKTNNGKTSKFLLKKISEKYLPKKIINRKKIGFSIPLEDWFRDKNGLGSLLSYLNDDIFKSRPFYNHKLITSLIDSHLKNKGNYGRILWVLINIEVWHRIFIDQTSRINKL